MKIKLSPAQLEVLVEIKRGEILHFVGGINAYWFLSSRKNRANIGTIYRLMEAGLIMEDNERYPSKAILTDKGRAYLDEIS